MALAAASRQLRRVYVRAALRITGDTRDVGDPLGLQRFESRADRRVKV